MNSFKKIIAGLFVSAMCFMLFAAKPKNVYAELGTEYTPDNSVVMIFAGYDGFALRQINPDFPPDVFTVSYDSGCTQPMLPGSCYMKTAFSVAGGYPCITDSFIYPYLNTDQNTDKFIDGLRITVPTKPGLYVYYVQYDIDEVKKNSIIIGNADSMNDVEAWKNSSIARNTIKKIFEKSAKLYAGTAWEPLINEYVEEWSK